MQAAYLYVNAVIYCLLAAWCTVSASRTATSIGYAALTPGGRSEYLVIYGGLQWGLGAIFAVLARNIEFNRIGIVLSVMLYAPMVVYRLVTVVKFRPVGIVTLATGCLEALLLCGALASYVFDV